VIESRLPLTPPQPPRPGAEARPSETRPIRVLLVDDHNLFREGVALVLSTHAGIEMVAEAGDGAGLFQVLETTEADVAILDLSLPDTDGLALTRTLRARYPALQIVILTMHRDAETVRQCLLAGAAAYVVKGARSVELIDAIRAVYRGERYVHSMVAAGVVEDSLRWMQAGSGLSPREREILTMLASGDRPTAIARALGISLHTVRRHIANLSGKLGISGIQGLVRYAIRHGLVRETV